MWGAGFRTWGLGFGVWGLGLGVSGFICKPEPRFMGSIKASTYCGLSTKRHSVLVVSRE